MNAPPLIHVGFHKTGTTWFQKALYPRVSNATLAERLPLQRVFLLPDSFSATDAADAMRVTRRLIICEEELSGNIHNGGFGGLLRREVARRLQAVFPDGRIVVFVRNQLDAIASTYRQYVREGGTYGVRRYLIHPDFPHPHRAPLFHFSHFDYAAAVADYAERFGPERVCVYLYEEFARDTRGFVGRFVERHDLDVDLGQLDFGARRNVGYGRLMLPIVRLCNHFTRQYVLYKHYLVHLPGWYSVSRVVLDGINRVPPFRGAGSAESLLGRDLAAEIRARFRLTNRQLASERGLPMEKYGYPL